jgi:hypothetical protein
MGTTVALSKFFVGWTEKGVSMKKLIAIALGILLVLPSLALAKDVHVKGYYRKDGT